MKAELSRGFPVLGLLFDMDGVIADTVDLHLASWRPIAEELGVSPSIKLLDRLRGRPRRDALELILEQSPRQWHLSEATKKGLCDKKNKIYVDSLATLSEKDILPGVVDTMRRARDGHAALAVASSSKNAHRVLAALGLLDAFDYIVDVRQIKHGKPAPDIYLAAARGLGLPPNACVGIEDAPAGVQAIQAAGMRAIGVGPKDRLVMADVIVDTLEDMVWPWDICSTPSRENASAVHLRDIGRVRQAPSSYQVPVSSFGLSRI